MNEQPDIPKFDEQKMLDGLLQALRELNGATFHEVTDRTADILHLTDEQRNFKQPKRNYTQFGYRLNWTRWLLKVYGLVESPKRGVWTLTTRGW